MNDLNTLPVTTEEEKQMEAIITGVSGNQYQPMDTTPQPTGQISVPTLAELFSTLASTLQQIGSHIESRYHQSSQDNLAEAVDSVLENADWLYAKLGDAMDKKYDIEDLVTEGVADRLETEVDNFFSRSFDIHDHVDFNDLISDAVSDQIADVVSDQLTEVVQEIFKQATVTVEF
jgi:hypothetical protein